MSVVRAILFYSKYDKKSKKMKTVIDTLGVDIDTICVDGRKVRENLAADDQYGIDQVPTILVLYSTGEYKTHIGKELDNWFQQLLYNIEQYKLQQEQEYPTQTTLLEPLPSTPAPPVPKPLQRKPTHTDIRTTLPSPGQAVSGIHGGGSGMAEAGMGGISAAQASMMSEHIRDPEPLVQISSEPDQKPNRREIKAEGMSAADLAKELAKQREQYEEKIEENKPFM